MTKGQTADLFSQSKYDAPCAYCGAFTYRAIEINPPDLSTRVMKYLCDHVCEANWGTNQPKPARPR